MSDLVLSGNVTSERNKVLQNTYRLLGLSMIPTVLGALVGNMMNWSWATAHPWMFFLGTLAVMFGFCFAIEKNKNSSMGVVLLLILTGFFGLLFGPILQQLLHMKNGVEVLSISAGTTGAVFFVLSAIASNPKRDFSGWGKFLFVGLLLFIAASFVNIVLGVSAMTLGLAGVGVVLFSAYTMYDINRIVQGGETNYITAALSIYLDLYNLFLNILQIVMALMGMDD